MFWGLIVEPNKSYSKIISTPFHLSQAVLDISSTTGNKDVQLFMATEEDEYILCNLNKRGPSQIPFDLVFSEGDRISFRCVGGIVHLSGYVMNESNFPDFLSKESSGSEHDTDCQIARKKCKVEQGRSTKCSTKEEIDDEKDVVMIMDDDAGVEESFGCSDEDLPLRREMVGGIITEEHLVGKGAVAKTGNTVRISYKCVAKSANKVWKEIMSAKEFEFKLGESSVIQGWNIGITGMKVGGKRKIICPPGKAYAAEDAPPAPSNVPRNKTLMYEIELINVRR